LGAKIIREVRTIPEGSEIVGFSCTPLSTGLHDFSFITWELPKHETTVQE